MKLCYSVTKQKKKIDLSFLHLTKKQQTSFTLKISSLHFLTCFRCFYGIRKLHKRRFITFCNKTHYYCKINSILQTIIFNSFFNYFVILKNLILMFLVNKIYICQ